MEDIKRKCNPMVDLSKFTSNKKILNKIVTQNYNQFLTKVSFFFFNIYNLRCSFQRNRWAIFLTNRKSSWKIVLN